MTLKARQQQNQNHLVLALSLEFEPSTRKSLFLLIVFFFSDKSCIILDRDINSKERKTGEYVYMHLFLTQEGRSKDGPIKHVAWSHTCFLSVCYRHTYKSQSKIILTSSKVEPMVMSPWLLVTFGGTKY